MLEFNYLASAHDIETLDAFARTFFAGIGVEHYEWRESSHYRDGRYARAGSAGAIYTVALCDESDHEDLPFWINVRPADEAHREQVAASMQARMRSQAARPGMKIALIENFGRRNEKRIDL